MTNLAKRIERLEAQFAARGTGRTICRWLNEGEDPDEMRAAMLSRGEIAESDYVQFIRWLTREEAKQPSLAQ